MAPHNPERTAPVHPERVAQLVEFEPSRLTYEVLQYAPETFRAVPTSRAERDDCAANAESSPGAGGALSGDGLGCPRGVLIGAPLAITLWVLIALAFAALAALASEPDPAGVHGGTHTQGAQHDHG